LPVNRLIKTEAAATHF